jgi:addiction module RelB/DinJ family antitoxin
MAQVSMTVRMDAQLKQNFDALCARMGMSVNAAINIFANAVVRTRSIPFKISVNPTEVEDQTLREFREFKKMVAASDRPELTLDEINEEIRLAREEMAAREKATL